MQKMLTSLLDKVIMAEYVSAVLIPILHVAFIPLGDIKLVKTVYKNTMSFS